LGGKKVLAEGQRRSGVSRVIISIVYRTVAIQVRGYYLSGVAHESKVFVVWPPLRTKRIYALPFETSELTLVDGRHPADPPHPSRAAILDEIMLLYKLLQQGESSRRLFVQVQQAERFG